MRLEAQGKESLRLIQTIPMPNVKGRIDHMDVDVKASGFSSPDSRMAPWKSLICRRGSG